MRRAVALREGRARSKVDDPRVMCPIQRVIDVGATQRTIDRDDDALRRSISL